MVLFYLECSMVNAESSFLLFNHTLNCVQHCLKYLSNCNIIVMEFQMPTKLQIAKLLIAKISVNFYFEFHKSKVQIDTDLLIPILLYIMTFYVVS